MYHKDIKNIVIVGGATILGGIINYLVHPFAVRMLATVDFAEFSTILGLINMLGFITNAGTVITLKLIAQHDNKSSFMYYLKQQLSKPLIITGLIIGCLLSLCAGRIAHLLHLSSGRGIVLMAIGFIPTIYTIILGAIMQSGGWFTSMSIINIVGSGIRLLCVIGALYFIGNGTATIGAITVAGLVAFGLTEYLVRYHVGNHSVNDIKIHDGTLIQELKHSTSSYLSLIIITILLGILTNSDILIAQYHFGSEISGLYASVAVIAKFVVFVGLAAETVLLPKLFTHQDISRRQVIVILGLLRGFGTLSLAGTWWIGDVILNTLKTGLGDQVQLLIYSVIINWSILSLGISSKTLISHNNRLPLWIIGIATIARYISATRSQNLEHYLRISSIILVSLSLLIQGIRIIYPTKRQSLIHHSYE